VNKPNKSSYPVLRLHSFFTSILPSDTAHPKRNPAHHNLTNRAPIPDQPAHDLRRDRRLTTLGQPRMRVVFLATPNDCSNGSHVLPAPELAPPAAHWKWSPYPNFRGDQCYRLLGCQLYHVLTMARLARANAKLSHLPCDTAGMSFSLRRAAEEASRNVGWPWRRQASRSYV